MTKARRRWLWLCACLAWMTLLPALSLAEEFTLTLNEAEFVLDDSQSPPSNATWQALWLPDNWNVSRPGQGGFGWYRLQFELAGHAQDAPQAIYVRKLSMNASFYVNGAFVAGGGSFDEPIARHWNRPLFFTIPPALLKQGRNELLVRLWAYPNSRGGLGEIRIGPVARLQPIYEQRYFLQTVLPQLCNIVVAAQGLIALAVWARRRAESYYVYFFAFTLLWTFRSTHMIVRDIPVPAFYWDIWVQSSFGWCALLFNVFAMRYSGARRPVLEKVLLVYAALGPVVMYLAGPVKVHAVASNWSFVIVPLGIYGETFLIRATLRNRSLEDALVALVWALVIAAAVHDGLVHRDKLAFDSFYLVSYVMILLCLVVGWHQTSRMVRALSESERLNLELEQRVAQKHTELEHNFRRLQEMERQTAVGEERRRMMSEMHDGIGSQLIATLDLVEHGEAPKTQVAGELRECLDSLRLAMDSLEPTDNDLLTVLGSLRYRLEGRLKRQGIVLDWQVRDVPKFPALTPQNVLHILRILQEAFTNVVKHARARTITVQTGCEGERVFIKVADDGCGFTGQREGRGLTNMRQRAQALGATLDITPSPATMTLSLYVPHYSS
jgi:signal transduction histidine kinase